MNQLFEYLKGKKPGKFKPQPFLNRDGNMVEWYFKDDRCYEESIHVDGVWVGSIERRMTDFEIVGVKIHLEAFMPKPPPMYDYADLES